MDQQTEGNALVLAEDASFVDQMLVFDFNPDGPTPDPANLMLTKAIDPMLYSPKSQAFSSVDCPSCGWNNLLAAYDASQIPGLPYDLSNHCSDISVDHQSSDWYRMLATSGPSQSSDCPSDPSNYSAGLSTNTSPLNLTLPSETLNFAEPFLQFFSELESCGMGPDQAMLDQQQRMISDLEASMGQMTDGPTNTDQQVDRLPSKASSSKKPHQRYICEECHRGFKAKRDLHRHINDIHQKLAMKMKIFKPKVSCPSCSRTFTRVYNLQRHQRKQCSCRPRTACRVLKPK